MSVDGVGGRPLTEAVFGQASGPPGGDPLRNLAGWSGIEVADDADPAELVSLLLTADPAAVDLAAIVEAERAAVFAGDEAAVRWLGLVLSWFALAQGDAATASRSRSGPPPPDAGEPDGLAAAWSLVEGRCLVIEGDADGATSALELAAERARAADLRVLDALASLALTELDPSRTPELLEHVDRLARSAPAHQRAALAGPLARRRTLEIDVLGPLAIRVHGEPCRFKTNHAARLVVILAFARAVGVHPDTLAEQLWPDKEPEDAMGNLATAVWEARQGLGVEQWRLERDADRVRLRPEGAHIDLDRAIAVLASDAQGREREQAREAVRRPVLPEWQHEEWVIELEHLRAATLEQDR